jgi:hypothetical protein
MSEQSPPSSDTVEVRAENTIEVRAEKTVTIAPAFKLVLFIVLGLSVTSYVGSVLLALFATPTDQTNNLIEAGSTIYKIGCGAIIGLLGGKVLP